MARNNYDDGYMNPVPMVTWDDKSEASFTRNYLMYLIEKYSDAICFEDLAKKADLSDERVMFVKHQLDVDSEWDSIKIRSANMKAEDLKRAILEYSDVDTFVYGLESSTPDCINELAAKLLDIKKKDKVADICCGIGTFLTYVDENFEVKQLYGNEITTSKKEIATIKSELYKAIAEIEQGNAFHLDYTKILADKVFSNYPWGVRYSLFDEDSEFAKMISGIPALCKNGISDWVYNLLLLNCMKEKGKAVAIMTNGSTWNTNSKEARKYFIENGYIEAIISLPQNIFPATNIGTTMIILSKNNQDVMLVNAENLFEQGRRKNSITTENIKRIIEATKKETDISKKVSIAEFEENEFGINPARYLNIMEELENTVPFGEIIAEIRRGAQISGSELDANASRDPTNTQYLMLSNIKNGMIDDELPYLKTLDKKHEKFCLHNDDMIISKIGTPAKIAIADGINPSTKIVANGNLYIVAIDKDKANPYYVKAFLESDIGRKLIESEMVGSQMKSISLERLKAIRIPMIPLDEQNELGANYQSKIDSLRLQKMRIEKTIEEINHFYDAWKDGD